MRHARLVFGIFIALSLATAVFHVVAVAAALDETPAWRHLLFAGINLALALGLWRRPDWLVWPLAALVAQQLWSHGHDLVAAARARLAVDWVSLGVLVAMPTLLALVWVDRSARRRARAVAEPLP